MHLNGKNLKSHIHFSEITGLQFELKFHMEYSVEKNNINMIFVLGHLTKMATMPIHGKTKYV